MSNATANGNGKAPATSEPRVYRFDATMTRDELTAEKADAFKALADGKLSPEEYTDLDSAYTRCVERLATSGKGKGGKGKTICPVTAEEFAEVAKQIGIDVGTSNVTAKPKVFSTGSFGWNYCGKVELPVGEESVSVQCSINLIVVGSKPEA